MPVRPKHWDRRRYPHPNIVAVPVVLASDSAWYLAASFTYNQAVGDKLVLLKEFTPAAAQRIVFSVDGSNTAVLTFRVEGEDQFGDRITDTASINTSTKGVTTKAFNRVTSITCTVSTTTDGAARTGNKVGVTLATGTEIGLPVRISSETYGAGGNVLAIVDRVGLAVTDAQVSLNTNDNTMKRDSGTWVIGVHHVFFDFDKVAAF